MKSILVELCETRPFNRAGDSWRFLARPSALSRWEAEVLPLVAASRSNREIGKAPSISLNTVDRYVSNIPTTIGATNRAEAGAFAVRHKLDH